MKTSIKSVVLSIFIFLTGNLLNAQTLNNTEISMFKSFDEESVETIKKFNLTDGFDMLSLELNGVVNKGVITVTIQKPDHSIFESIDLDNSAIMDYKKAIELKEDSAGMVGEWLIKITANKAKGYYRLVIRTYKDPLMYYKGKPVSMENTIPQ